MSIRAGVIVAVTFQQVDRAPDTKTGTESHDESLQYTDCAVEKCHTEASFFVSLAGVIVCIAAAATVLSEFPVRWSAPSCFLLPLKAAGSCDFSSRQHGGSLRYVKRQL